MERGAAVLTVLVLQGFCANLQTVASSGTDRAARRGWRSRLWEQAAEYLLRCNFGRTVGYTRYLVSVEEVFRDVRVRTPPRGTAQSPHKAWYEFHLVLATATMALLFHPRVGTRFYREHNEELGLDDWTALVILPNNHRRFLFHIQIVDCPPEPQPVVEVSSEKEVPSPRSSAEAAVEVSDYEVD